MHMNRNGARRGRSLDSALSSAKDERLAVGPSDRRCSVACRRSGWTPPEGGTVCAQQLIVRTCDAARRSAATRNRSENRRIQTNGISDGIGSLAWGVGRPSRAPERTDSYQGGSISRRKCLRAKVSLLECR
jgi:hypothetical protein